MKVAIVFDPDLDLGFDPLDEAKQPRSQGVFIPDNADCLIVWKEWGDQFEGGSRTHVIGQGVWENVGLEAAVAALDTISGLEEEAPA